MYTVCIATSGVENKLKALRLTIRSIKAQSLPPDKIIVAINQGYSQKLHEKLEEQSPDVVFIFADQKLNNVSYARNEAAKQSNTEFIVFLDDDTVVGGLHVLNHLFMHARAYDFSCGAKRLWAPSNWEDKISEISQISFNMNLLSKISIEPINLNRNNGKQKLSNYSFIGNFGIVRKDYFFASGGFDEDFGGWGYEDADLMQELFHRGAKFMLMESVGICCYHLSHPVDKSKVLQNIDLYNLKIKARGQHFNLNHYFGVFENDGFSSVYSL